MDTQLTLLVLRFVSGLLLLLLLLVLFVVIWRDYRSTVAEVEARKRTHGQLVAMREVNGQYALTGATHALMPLTSLGRAPTNTILVEDSFASSEHCILAQRNGQWWLEDRQSRNGTTLNELPVKHPVVITDGDIIGIGNMRYRVELEN